jgi:DedD protein
VESATRERLTGAVIFVVAFAIVASEMFSGRDEATVAPEQAAPAEAGPPMATFDLPLNPSAAPATVREQPAVAAEVPAVAQAVPPPAAEPADVAGEAAPPPSAASRPTEPPKPAAAEVAGAGWWVQLGSFASAENAQKLTRELRARGFPMELVTVKTAGGDMHRVRAGPVKDRQAATELKNRIGPSARDARLVAP